MECLSIVSATVGMLNTVVAATRTVGQLASSMSDAGLEMHSMRDEVHALEGLLKPLQSMQELQPELTSNLSSLLDNCRSIEQDLEKLKRHYLANSLEWAMNGKTTAVSLQKRLKMCRDSLDMTLQGIKIENLRSMKKATGDMREQSEQRIAMHSTFAEAEPAGISARTQARDGRSNNMSTHARTVRSTKTWRNDEETTESGAMTADAGSTQYSPVSDRSLMDSSRPHVLYASSDVKPIDSAELFIEECDKIRRDLVELRCKHNNLLENDNDAKMAVDGTIVALQAALDQVKPSKESSASHPKSGKRSVRKMTRWLLHDKTISNQHLLQLLDQKGKALRQMDLLEHMAADAQKLGQGTAGIHQQRERVDKRDAEGLERLNKAMGN